MLTVAVRMTEPDTSETRSWMVPVVVCATRAQQSASITLMAIKVFKIVPLCGNIAANFLEGNTIEGCLSWYSRANGETVQACRVGRSCGLGGACEWAYYGDFGRRGFGPARVRGSRPAGRSRTTGRIARLGELLDDGRRRLAAF